ncbi:MAG: metal-dependent hydrolase, partial [Acidimicrobiales bacterium]
MSDIVVRKVRFEFPDDLGEVFAGDEPDEDLFRVAFSLTLPHLEPYLIRVYRGVLDHLRDPELLADVQAFIGQEAQHHRNHRRANDMVKAQLGPDAAARLTAVEDELEADYQRFTARGSARANLVYAEGFEAMTCAWAVSSFERAAAPGGAPTRYGPWQQLWAWHAAEEIEHRTVAFRVYEELVGSYSYRVAGSLWAQAHFLRYTDRLERIICEARGLPFRTHVPRAISGGPRRWLRTFRPDYDPADVAP